MNYQLYEAVLNDTRIPQIESSVLRYIVFRCNGEGLTCYFSLTKAAKQIKITRPRLSRAVIWLRKNSYISTKFNGRFLTFEVSSWITAGVSSEHSRCAPRPHRTRSELAKEHSAPSRGVYRDQNGPYIITPERFRRYISEEEAAHV